MTQKNKIQPTATKYSPLQQTSTHKNKLTNPQEHMTAHNAKVQPRTLFKGKLESKLY